ncbi:MAG: D-2-hydroxyacid dehydrogenase [Actinomycetota bacterium]
MSEPFVLAVLGPLMPDGLEGRLQQVDVDVEVVHVPYFESNELRTSRGHNAGKDPLGLAVPDLGPGDRANLARAHGMVSLDLPDDIAVLAPRLRWFQGVGAGFDHIDRAALADMGAVQSTASGIAAVPIAEFVVARLLQVWKHLRSLDDGQNERAWVEQYGMQMEGRTLGIVGLGAIGRALAVRARAFGMTVLATRGSARPGDTDPDVDELWPATALDDVLPRCDAVVLCLPAAPEVQDLMDARRIALMAEGSILVNVARGMHVVEADLIEALESGHLAAAVLDVTREEPLPAADPLWSAPNLYLSPHSAVSLDRYEATLFELVADNLGRLLRGDDLRNVVGPPG